MDSALRRFLWLFAGFLLSSWMTRPVDASPIGPTSPVLLVVSYDSFNRRYLEQLDLTPNLNKVREEGVSVPHLENVFTTKTFPNHFSIATGLYPARHGVVNSNIFDRKTSGNLSYGDEYYHMDKDVTPIWVSASTEIRG